MISDTGDVILPFRRQFEIYLQPQHNYSVGVLARGNTAHLRLELKGIY